MESEQEPGRPASGRSRWLPNPPVHPIDPIVDAAPATLAPSPETRDDGATQYTASGHGELHASEELLAPGTMLGDELRIERVLGRGGMGLVYLATDLRLQRPVAVKVQTEGAGGTSRLLREAQSLARLTHPNVLAVYDVGTLGAGVYIAMEYVDGDTARGWLRARPRGWREVVDLYLQAAHGLAAAHAAGIVHRDFKPENLLLGRDGRLRVADFGIAQGLGGTRGTVLTSPAEAGGERRLTATGALLGTPAYMAPEQFEGGALDGRANQFAFCVSLFEAVYGVRPFPGPSAYEFLLQVRAGRPPPAPAGRAAPAWLHAVLCRGLAPDPAARHPSMDALIHELTRDRRESSALPLVAGGFVLVALLGGGAAFAWMWSERSDEAALAPVRSSAEAPTTGDQVAAAPPRSIAPNEPGAPLGDATPDPAPPPAPLVAAPPPDLPPVSHEPLWDGRSTLSCVGDAELEIIGQTIRVADGPAFDIGGDCRLTVRDSDIEADVIFSGGGTSEVHLVLTNSQVRARTSVVSMGGSAKIDIEKLKLLAPCEGPVFDLAGNVVFRISGSDVSSPEVFYVAGYAEAHLVDGRFEGERMVMVATGGAQVVLGDPVLIGPSQQLGNAVLRRHRRD